MGDALAVGAASSHAFPYEAQLLSLLMKTDGLRPGNLVFSTQLSYLKWSTALVDKNRLSNRTKKLPHPKISDAQMVIFSLFLKLGEIRTAAHKLEAVSKCFVFFCPLYPSKNVTTEPHT